MKKEKLGFKNGFGKRIVPDSKHAQHEIIGFVLIIIVVTVIGFIFLLLIFGKGSTNKNSVEISNILGASMYYTTDCVTSYVPQYKEMQDLIKVVYKTPELKCLDGRNVSYALSTNLKTIIDKSLEVHEKGVNKAYTLNIYYRDSESERPDKEILFFKEGVFSNCSSIPGGWKHINKDSGIINIELEVCRG